MSESIVGVDVGGTFTDLVVMEPATGDVRIAKVPTTVDNQAFGVLEALDAGVPGSYERVEHRCGKDFTTSMRLEVSIFVQIAKIGGKGGGLSQCLASRPRQGLSHLLGQAKQHRPLQRLGFDIVCSDVLGRDRFFLVAGGIEFVVDDRLGDLGQREHR